MQQPLTPREKELAKHLAMGLSHKMIVDQMGIAIGTVWRHRCNLFRKTGSHNLADLTRFAVREKIIQV